VQYFNNLTPQASAQSINRVLKTVDVPDATLDRLAVFEDIIIDAFLYTLVGERIPLLLAYLDTLLTQKPELKPMIKNRLGQLGIKSLAGVPVVMLKEFDSDIVEKSLPGLIPMLMHHLLEVVSDKLESDQLSEMLNIPKDFAADFALFAYEILGGRPVFDLQKDALIYLKGLSIHEVQLTKVESSIGKLLDPERIIKLGKAHDFPDKYLTQAKTLLDNPVKWMLMMNLLAIEVATHHLNHAYAWSEGRLIHCEDPSPLKDFGVQALGARYFSVAITEDPGYAQMDIDHAVETRADSILTNYTMTAVISALAVADPSIRKRVEAEQSQIQDAIHYATSLIGLANDCGSALMRMSPNEILDEVDKLRVLTPSPRPTTNDNPIAKLHQQAKEGNLADEYLALFPLIKDIAKGERNLALDCHFDKDLEGWDNVAYNLVQLANYFTKSEQKFLQQSQALSFQKIARLMDNFVQYNFQIYDLGADYDHQNPIIEQLDIIK